MAHTCKDMSVTAQRQGASPAMRALLHPWSLLALAVLGFNDHIWKGVGPAWLTGKLSDVAGLFYFPFLVLLLLSWLLPARWTRQPRKLAIGVFWGVGIWFAAAKTIPVVHSATVAFAELFLGKVQVVKDPGDAIALLSLLPAWLLYKRILAAPPKSVSRVWQPAALGVVVLLTAASGRPWASSVDKLIVHEGQLYAHVGNYYDVDDYYSGIEKFYTTEDGVTWTRAEALPPEVVEAHKPQHAALWKGEILMASGTAVLSAQGTNDFRISEGRKEFMRSSGGTMWAVSDMAVLPNRDDTVVVGLGTEGVAVLDKSGVWARHPVDHAIPTPTEMRSYESIALPGVSLAVFGISTSLICWILVSFLIWRSWRLGVPASARLLSDRTTAGKKFGLAFQNALEIYSHAIRGHGHLLRAMGCMLVPAIMFWGQLDPHAMTGDGPFFAIVSTPFLLLSFVLIAVKWNDFNQQYDRKPKTTYFLSTLPVGAMAMASLVLWYFGYLESVSTAVCLSAALILVQVTIIAGRLPRQ